MKIWKDYVIEDALIVREKAVKAIKSETNSCRKTNKQTNKKDKKLCPDVVCDFTEFADRASQGNHERGCEYMTKKWVVKRFKIWILEKLKS